MLMLLLLLVSPQGHPEDSITAESLGLVPPAAAAAAAVVDRPPETSEAGESPAAATTQQETPQTDSS